MSTPIASAIVLKDRSSEHEPDFALYSDIARAIMAEREACAQVADCDCSNPGCERQEIADAIRNRSQT